MLLDRVISIWTVAASLLWGVSLALVLVDLAMVEPRVGNLGLFLTGAASVATICRSIQSASRAQLNAFELGRDSVRRIR